MPRIRSGFFFRKSVLTTPTVCITRGAHSVELNTRRKLFFSRAQTGCGHVGHVDRAFAQRRQAGADAADRLALDLAGQPVRVQHHRGDHVGHGFRARIAELLAGQVLHGLDALVVLAGDPDLVGDAGDAGMHDGELEPLLRGRDHGGQRDVAIGKLGGEHVAHGGAAARRGEEAGDVEARLLEVALLLGDRIGHAVHAGAEMRDVELDRPARRRLQCDQGGGRRERQANHGFPPFSAVAPFERWRCSVDAS